MHLFTNRTRICDHKEETGSTVSLANDVLSRQPDNTEVWPTRSLRCTQQEEQAAGGRRARPPGFSCSHVAPPLTGKYFNPDRPQFTNL